MRVARILFNNDAQQTKYLHKIRTVPPSSGNMECVILYTSSVLVYTSLFNTHFCFRGNILLLDYDVENMFTII